MCLARKGDYFYCNNHGPVIHRISEVKVGFTPADTECEEYEAICGASGQSWSSPSMGVPETRIVKGGEPFPAHVKVCNTCFAQTMVGKPLEKEIDEMQVWGKVAKAECSKCGGEARCQREEIGGWDAYVGEYTLTCKSCGHTETQIRHEGWVGCSDEKPICPFCNEAH